MINTKITLEIDPELIRDFADSVEDNCDVIDGSIADAKNNPHDPEPVAEIFRQLHSIKGNARMCELETLEHLVHRIENLITRMREESVPVGKSVADMMLLVTDQLKQCAQHLISHGNLPEQSIQEFQQYMDEICQCPPEAIEECAIQIIQTITGGSTNDEKGYAKKSDVEFFKKLALRLEQNIEHWESRSQNILALAHAMNNAAGCLVDPLQLEMAVYVHDLGIAFVSQDLIHKQGSYTDEEFTEIGQHVKIAADLLRPYAGWEAAQVMVRQHHEHVDGTGYPGGLTGAEIVDGAKIIAIADAFEAMTHPRPDRALKHSVLIAVKEINACSGKQFCTDWVKLFNQSIRNKYVKPGD